MIPPPAQAFMADRMGATVRSVAASHAPFMSRPQDVANIINDAADQEPHPDANLQHSRNTASSMKYAQIFNRGEQH